MGLIDTVSRFTIGVQYASIDEQSTSRQRRDASQFSNPLSGLSGRKKSRVSCRPDQKWYLAFWKRTIEDLKRIKWRTKPAFVYNNIMPFVVIGGLIVAAWWIASTPSLTQNGSLCRPDGTVSQDSAQYNPWNSSEAFTINIAFGRRSFGEVKVIDVAWDLVVGRGGQSLMALISYRTVSSSLSQLMESRPVSFGTFEAVMLQDGTLKALWKLGRDFKKNETVRSKVAILTMMVIAVLVLIFPTLASAMTGYTPVFDTEIKLMDGRSVLASSMHRVWYVIHDGARLGQGFYDNYLVLDSGNADPDISGLIYSDVPGSDPSTWEENRSFYMYDCSKVAPGKVDKKNDTIVLQPNADVGGGSSCDLLWEISRYIHTYGESQPNRTNTVFGKFYNKSEVVIPGPPLNITMLPPLVHNTNTELMRVFASHELVWSVVPYGLSWGKDNVSGEISGLLPAEDMELTTNFFAVPETQPTQAMSNYYLRTNAHCRQQGPGDQSAIQYQWGFAYQPLFMFFLLLLLWMILISLLFVHTLLYTAPRSYPRTSGLRRAILDIAPKYQEHLNDQDVTMSSDGQIRTLVRDGTISYEGLNKTNRYLMRRAQIGRWWRDFNIRRWAREEWKWLTVLGALCILWVLALSSFLHSSFGDDWTDFDNLYYGWDLRFSTIPIAGVLAVLFVGGEHASRWLWFALAVAVFVPLQITSLVHNIELYI